MINGTVFILCILGIFVFGVVCGKFIPKINLIPREKKKNHAYTHKRDDWRPGF